MGSILELARPDLAKLRPYTPGAWEPGLVRLNANESPWRSPADRTDRGLNSYPPPRPYSLRKLFSDHYGVAEEELLVTRGSSEAIDALIRGFCTAGQDAILTTPPTFDMYRLYAGIQAAEVITVPLLRNDDFALPTDDIIARLGAPVKIVFLCSPNNPTGTAFTEADILRIIEAASDRALVVIDEAYQEFSSQPGFTKRRSQWQHVVVLRTLSKFVALAGARCGFLCGTPELVEYLGNVLPPYTFPTPTIEQVHAAFTEEAMQISAERIGLIRRERNRLADNLSNAVSVRRVFASDGNFVLVQARDGEQFARQAHQAGILVRQFPGQDELKDCVRVTVGKPEENDRLIRAISGGAEL